MCVNAVGMTSGITDLILLVILVISVQSYMFKDGDCDTHSLFDFYLSTGKDSSLTNKNQTSYVCVTGITILKYVT